MHWPSSPARDNDLQHPHPEPLHHFQSSHFHGHVLEEVSRFFILSKYRRKIGDSKYVQGVVILSPESTVWAPQQVSAHQPSSSWSPLAMPHSKPSATNRNFRRAKIFPSSSFPSTTVLNRNRTTRPRVPRTTSPCVYPSIGNPMLCQLLQ
jgi:hypothetical protein